MCERKAGKLGCWPHRMQRPVGGILRHFRQEAAWIKAPNSRACVRMRSLLKILKISRCLVKFLAPIKAHKARFSMWRSYGDELMLATSYRSETNDELFIQPSNRPCLAGCKGWSHSQVSKLKTSDIRMQRVILASTIDFFVWPRSISRSRTNLCKWCYSCL